MFAKCTANIDWARLRCCSLSIQNIYFIYSKPDYLQTNVFRLFKYAMGRSKFRKYYHAKYMAANYRPTGVL